MDDKSTNKKRKKEQPVLAEKATKDAGSDLEEGECSDSDSSDNNSCKDCILAKTEQPEEQILQLTEVVEIIKAPVLDESSRPWPPCMRVVVKETGLEELSIGTLFVVTCSGGTLGREGQHAVLIPDISVSKYHAKFSFNNQNEEKRQGCYTVIDLGSRNGTFLDGKRLSVALQESPPHTVSHESVLKVGSTSLVCHIHEGGDTCENCEPGILISAASSFKEVNNDISLESSKSKHKKELKKLKKRFGLERSGKEMVSAAAPVEGYEDKAQKRRQIVGSNSEAFKTETTSVLEPIATRNKGFKMLSKMGWNKGESLGKSKEGIKEPVLVCQREDKVGLGYESALQSASGSLTVKLNNDSKLNEEQRLKIQKKKQEIWRKTNKRFKDIS